MKHQYINTSIGKIAVYQKELKGTTPVIFLHGVYYDHNLWNYQTSRITDRTVITLDMPLHGKSKEITKTDWSLDDCGKMLLEVLDALAVDKVIAIGHSWGSMTILRAAHRAPEKFRAVGFCNMPFEPASKQTKRQFKLQHFFLPFRNFYANQVAKFVYGKETLKNNPELLEHLKLSMNQLTNQELKQTDTSVIINADDGELLIQALKVPAKGLKGKEDYIAEPAHFVTQIVKGGHISPLEAPEEVYAFVRGIMKK